MTVRCACASDGGVVDRIAAVIQLDRQTAVAGRLAARQFHIAGLRRSACPASAARRLAASAKLLRLRPGRPGRQQKSQPFHGVAVPSRRDQRCRPRISSRGRQARPSLGCLRSHRPGPGFSSSPPGMISTKLPPRRPFGRDQDGGIGRQLDVVADLDHGIGKEGLRVQGQRGDGADLHPRQAAHRSRPGCHRRRGKLAVSG